MMVEPVKIPIPAAALPELEALYQRYMVARRELACYVQGLAKGLGLQGDIDLDTTRMLIEANGHQS